MRKLEKKLKNPDRLPPHSAEAEQAVLGCVLLSPESAMSQCQEAGVNGGWFYDLRHATIWGAMERNAADGKGLDAISVWERLKELGLVEQCGGLAYMTALPDVVPSSGMVEHYLAIARDKFKLRQALRAAANAAMEIYEFEGEVEDFLGRYEKSVLEVREVGESGRESTLKDVLVAEVLPDLENYKRGTAQIKGLRMGIPYFDKLVGGIGGEEDYFWVIGARPRTGKTSLALDFVSHVACTEGHPVGIFSMEMTRKALGKRLLFQRARADLQRWRTGFATNEDMPPLVNAAAQLAKAAVFIDDTARMTIEALKAKARRWYRQHGIKFFVIDYLQLMRVGGKRYREDRVQELAEVSGEIQALGKELKVPFLVLAQLNRDYEKDPNRAPRLSDLKDCGAIEQDADGVAFLYRPKLKDAVEEFYDTVMKAKFGKLNRDTGEVDVDWSKAPARINLLVDKNRFGPGGICELLFHHSCTHFEDWNEWLKDNKFKERAAGEQKQKEADQKADQEAARGYNKHGPLPTNEELGM